MLPLLEMAAIEVLKQGGPYRPISKKLMDELAMTEEIIKDIYISTGYRWIYHNHLFVLGTFWNKGSFVFNLRNGNESKKQEIRWGSSTELVKSLVIFFGLEEISSSASEFLIHDFKMNPMKREIIFLGKCCLNENFSIQLRYSQNLLSMMILVAKYNTLMDSYISVSKKCLHKMANEENFKIMLSSSCPFCG